MTATAVGGVCAEACQRTQMRRPRVSRKRMSVSGRPVECEACRLRGLTQEEG